ncbi:MAG: RAD55 family ATPase [Thermoplasmata archaeon]
MIGMPLRGPLSRESEEELQYDPVNVRRIPTGVADFDTIVKGGLPSGSLVLLLGDVGAGQQEYIYTSAAKLAIVRDNPNLRRYYLGQACNDGILPEKIEYVTFSRSEEDIFREVAASFNPHFYNAFRKYTNFKDFSGHYFRHTVVPSSWTSREDIPFGEKPPELLESVVDFLDSNARKSMVIIDSITDLVETDVVSTRDLISTIKGMQRASKRWDGIVYLLLTKGIMEEKFQQMLIDSVDGVIVFEWSTYLNSSKRQRYMYVWKFMSVLPHLELEKIARFPTMVTSNHGLIVVNMERIA